MTMTDENLSTDPRMFLHPGTPTELASLPYGAPVETAIYYPDSKGGKVWQGWSAWHGTCGDVYVEAQVGTGPNHDEFDTADFDDVRPVACLHCDRTATGWAQGTTPGCDEHGERL